MIVPRPYTEALKKLFLLFGPKIWNKVNPDAINIASDSTFKRYDASLLFGINNIEEWLSVLG